MPNVRMPAVSGAFYPATADELSNMVESFLDAGSANTSAAQDTAMPASKALIVPHAGYIYSGEVAGAAYQRLRVSRDKIKRVVLLGPSHRVAFQGIAAPSSAFFETPLGNIPIDLEMIAQMVNANLVQELDQAHVQEHSLEVQLPFLQKTLSDFKLIPLIVGDASKEAVARVIERLWGGDETLIVISSDLSHYHDYETAKRRDAETARKITSLNPILKGEDACGCRCINGLIEYAKNSRLQISEIKINNSGDTAGDKSRVVGYGSFNIVSDQTQSQMPDSYSIAQRQQLLQVAREAILRPLISKENYQLDLANFSEKLREERASFVTLQINDMLRGCIGSLAPHRALVADVAHNAQAAAYKDPRFKPLTMPEFHDITIHISVLSLPRHVECADRASLIEFLTPGKDGLIIEENGMRATYLPSVWEQLPDPENFVSELRRKAGLAPGGWSDDTRVMHYTTEEFC